MMRVLFLLIFLAGLALGVGYPMMLDNVPQREIGTWQVYDPARGFRSAEAVLSPGDAPVHIVLDITTVGHPSFSADRTVLTLTADFDSRTFLAKTLSFSGAAPHLESPQSSGRIFREEVGVIPDVREGTYVFTAGPGDAEGLELASARLILQSGGAAYDGRVQPTGFILMAIGFIGFVMAMRRGGGRPQNPNSQPPPPRWGRNARNKQ
ncbi:MAG TPA: hypothetical protein VNS34_12035 [Rhizobiaceae bacterium]|nr:hypothetical protein [Rhizobiaceae bacterium]